MRLLAWRGADRAGLVAAEAPADVSAAIERRIVFAQALYGEATLLGMFDTRIGIVVIVLVQLNYAVAPRLGRLRPPHWPF